MAWTHLQLSVWQIIPPPFLVSRLVAGKKRSLAVGQSHHDCISVLPSTRSSLGHRNPGSNFTVGLASTCAICFRFNFITAGESQVSLSKLIGTIGLSPQLGYLLLGLLSSALRTGLDLLYWSATNVITTSVFNPSQLINNSWRKMHMILYVQYNDTFCVLYTCRLVRFSPLGHHLLTGIANAPVDEEEPEYENL